MMDEKSMMQVPPQVRDMAEKTVEQAEKAFGAFLEAANRSAETVPHAGSDFSKQIMGLTEQNMKSVFDHAKALIHATDMNEIVRLQSDFLQKQFAAAAEQMRKLGGSVADVAKKVLIK